MFDPHTLHPAALPMLTIQTRKPACSNLDPEVTRRYSTIIIDDWNPMDTPKCSLCQCVTKTQSWLRLYLCPVRRITTAAINIKLSCPIWHRLFLPSQPLFSVTTTSPRRPYPLWGAWQLGLGWTGERICGALQELRGPSQNTTSMAAKTLFFRSLQTVTDLL